MADSSNSGSTHPDLALGFPSGENYGWGVCGKYLQQELGRLCRVVPWAGQATEETEDIPVFQALEGVSLKPLFEARPERNVGYVFFEDCLNEQSRAHAAASRFILAGSTWCVDRLKEAGVNHCDLLIQGIDPELFYPLEELPPDSPFVFFSGGKFELRKGQDLVLKAFSILHAKYPDTRLLTVWANQWPASMDTMAASRHIRYERIHAPWPQQLAWICAQNGIAPEMVQALPLLPNRKMRAVFAKTHVGIFPNRCEGGTNLVLMEYMACGKPAIASLTSGHRDVVTQSNSLPLTQFQPMIHADASGRILHQWDDPCLDELVARMEYAYLNRDALLPLAQQAGKDMQALTWRAMAEKAWKRINDDY